MATFGTFVANQTLTAAELNTAGAWQAYTPTWTQSVAITKTVNWARYTQLGKWVQGSVKMTATGAGTANNKMLVGLPVNASSDNFILGQFFYNDVSFANANTYAFRSVFFESASTISFFPSYSLVSSLGYDDAVQLDARFGQNYTTSGGTSRTGITVASGDIIYIQFAYEAA
jgi:hypothetical protein